MIGQTGRRIRLALKNYELPLRRADSNRYRGPDTDENGGARFEKDKATTVIRWTYGRHFGIVTVPLREYPAPLRRLAYWR